MKKVCVFCGSSTGSNTIYSEVAEKLGTCLAGHSIALVYGGGDIGLMGILSTAVMESGGHVTGIIPELISRHIPHKNISELIIVKTMHERKAMMYSMSDAFICLPGGIGSLEELMEVFTWLQLGYHSKPVLLLNINGFYDNLLKQFDTMVSEGFLKKEHLSNLKIRNSIDNILEDLFTINIIEKTKW